MNKPSSEESKLWLAASALLEREGDNVADYIVQRVQAVVDSGDEAELPYWVAMAGRVMDLLDQEGKAT